MKRAVVGVLAVMAGLVMGCGSASSDGGAEAEDQDGSVASADDSTADSDDTDGLTETEPAADAAAEDEDEDAATPDSSDDPAPENDPAPPPPTLTLTVVSAEDDLPIEGAVAAFDDETIEAGADGRIILTVDADEQIMIRRPTFLPVVIAAPAESAEMTVVLDPVLARGVRVSREVAADPQRYRDLLDQLEETTVNSLVFDTKDETGQVLYDTEVEAAASLDAVEPLYEPSELVAEAIERGLYPITRVVTFEDRIWAAADDEAKLAGAWVDATDEANWAYPIALAEEACRLGFAEIQFDYVRYPAGRSAELAADRVPDTAEERAAVIGAFLAEAKTRLEPMGCGVSAAIFGIVMSSETDEGIGQTVEAVSAEVDAVSPMLYPSHYGPGWLGFADPNDHPGPVIADALDDGLPRLSQPIQMRPWIQAFYYNGAQIGAQIDEAEARGAGWLLWNASGRYRDDWLPASS